MNKTSTIKIIFEDHGQKFKSWVIDENGKILISEPDEAWIFTGLFINNPKTLEVGGFVEMGTNRIIGSPIKELIHL